MERREMNVAELTVKRPGAYTGLRITSLLVLALVLIQAAMAGRGLFFGGDWITIHGFVANLTMLTALAQAILVFVAGLSGRYKTSLIVTTLLLVVLIVVQIGLGYTGNDDATAASIHVPNGVLIFGVSTVAACLTWLRTPLSERTS